MSIYSQNILEHYKNPSNFWEKKDCDCIKSQENRSCWDTVKIFLDFDWKSVKKMQFSWKWCAISMACSSILSEEIIWMSFDEVLKLKLEDIEDMIWLKLWVWRIKCWTLALETLKSAVKEFN